MPPNRLDATLVAAYPITPHVKHFLLRVDDHTFDFRPGQHVSVAAEDEGGARVYRPYSPVNQPGTNTIGLAVKQYPDGTGSTWMHEREVGDTISLLPPSGNLHVRDLARDGVFLCTGTGLTPMLSMATQYLAEGQGHATLLFGERTQDDLMFREVLDLYAASHANVTVDYVLSEEDWSGPTGYVQDYLPESIDDVSTPHFYICGVPEMVVETQAVLRELGAPDDHVFTEGWEEGAVEE